MANRPLPGISFQVPSASVDEGLPRMDIAAFAGFAERGPLHTPVPVEDVSAFRDLFGKDPLLAREAGGAVLRGFLGSAVEGFFANGGRRAWIVRVASTEAEESRFVLSSLVGVDHREATVRARAPGSWADDLQVSTRLRTGHLSLLGAAMADDGGHAVLTVAGSELAAGDLIELCVHATVGSHKLAALFYVEQIAASDAGLQVAGDIVQWFLRYSPEASPPDATADPVQVAVTQEQAARDLEMLAVSSPGYGTFLAQHLSFDLLVWEGERVTERVNELAFHPDHPRYWAALPDDATLFRIGFGREYRAGPAPALLGELTEPRFSLAGPAIGDGESEPYLPWDMPQEADPANAVSRDTATEAAAGAPLVRDGLDTLVAAHFLDEEEINSSAVDRLLAEVENKLYRRNEDLRGIYSLLPVREASIIAAPDALHLDRTVVPATAAKPLDAPVLEPIEISGPHISMRWSAVAADSYRLEQSTEASFAARSVVYEGAATSTLLTLPDDCPETVHLRVRAARFGEVGPWSNTRVRRLPDTDFAACGGLDPRTLELTLGGAALSGTNDVRLRWAHARPPSRPLRYIVESAGNMAFVDADAVESAGPSITIPGPEIGFSYHRVRASIEGAPWSNTVQLAAFAFDAVTEEDGQPKEPGRHILAVQCALIRFCAARRDTVAVLSAPRSDHVTEVLDHVRALAPELLLEGRSRLPVEGVSELAANVRRLGRDEAETLDFACVYYPWSVLSTGPTQSRSVPPEGAVCGQFAQRAIERGAWVAPANLALAGVLAPAPRLGHDAWGRLRDARVNFIRQDRAGLSPFDATTLGLNDATRPINVRRLLILLRRLALREGEREVFEPHSIDFRNRVRHRFERALSGLFARGAFAGDSPRQAFRVVADDSVNPSDSVDRGRFIVDLQVAPSRPLEFLKVRLVQSGPEQLQLEGA